MVSFCLVNALSFNKHSGSVVKMTDGPLAEWSSCSLAEWSARDEKGALRVRESVSGSVSRAMANWPPLRQQQRL